LYSSSKLSTIVTNQNLIQEESKTRLNSDNACYHSVQNLLFSRMPSKRLKLKLCKIIILPMVLYGWQNFYLILREENRLRVYENTFLRRMFGPRRDEVTGGWRKSHNVELHNLSSPSSTTVITQQKYTHKKQQRETTRITRRRHRHEIRQYQINIHNNLYTMG
jgi:hypothetical protein